MNIDKMELWKKRIADQKASGQKVYEWCSDNNLSKHAYYYWHKKITDYECANDENNKQEIFAEISIEEPYKPDEVNNNVSDTDGLCIVWSDITLKVNNTAASKLAAHFINNMRQLC